MLAMSRAFCVPAILFLFCALILNVLITISVPTIPALNIVRVERYRVSPLFFLRQLSSQANFLACKVGYLVRILFLFCGQPCTVLETYMHGPTSSKEC